MSLLIALDTLPERPIEVGALLTVVVVQAANVVKDIRENIRNLVGGRMVHYESLIRVALDEALRELEARAEAEGYDGVVGLKIGHPAVVEGAVQIVVYGNGFRYRGVE